MGKAKSCLILTAKVLNDALSFIIFSVLDVLDFILCLCYKLADFIIDSEWRPCYCSSGKGAIVGSGNILVSEHGKSKVVCLSSSKLELEEISDTLYTRPSLVSEISKFTVNELKKLKVDETVRSTFTVNSTIVEMLQGKLGVELHYPTPRWDECDCHFCYSFTSSQKETLFLRSEGAQDNIRQDVLFIHGFISSSAFWTETVFPNFTNATKSSYRLFAFDLLGFGRSPKPNDSLYTLKEHIDMIEKSVLLPYNVNSFHIVAHSLGCILALALAVRHPGSIKSLTLLAPPYYPTPKGEQPTQYMMRRIAPRRVWPLISFGASVICWYEHISRITCLILCKHHRLWEFLTKLVTRNRVRTFLMEGFFCHTHNGSWHTLHNIICGTAAKVNGYLDIVRESLNCDVTIFHGRDDELIPVECSYNVQKKIPRACVKVFENKDHITIVVGRQKAFARDLEEIWRNSSG